MSECNIIRNFMCFVLSFMFNSMHSVFVIRAVQKIPFFCRKHSIQLATECIADKAVLIYCLFTQKLIVFSLYSTIAHFVCAYFELMCST